MPLEIQPMLQCWCGPPFWIPLPCFWPKITGKGLFALIIIKDSKLDQTYVGLMVYKTIGTCSEPPLLVCHHEIPTTKLYIYTFYSYMNMFFIFIYIMSPSDLILHNITCTPKDTVSIDISRFHLISCQFITVTRES